QSLVINGTGTFNQGGAKTISENFLISTGTFKTQSYDLTISTNSTQTNGLVQLGTSVVTLQGNFLRTGGTFDAATSTINFAGSGAQNINSNGQSFGVVVSSNVSSSGLTFVSSFTATQLRVNTSALSSGATMYFASNSTCTIGNFNLNGAVGKY